MPRWYFWQNIENMGAKLQTIDAKQLESLSKFERLFFAKS